ncbi:unnamed protein product [Rotaria socialis]|uniref:Uncharacterized protein n=1 Tax=Rotaria socialis TaxID=392032 RepID=A0A818Z546_9BILA|nr:unnamed protein product [Rotaria socialis]CAF3758930.1 unnamed protein product [Rotaria socialis]CAF4657503.1 unnamed protein product [Rotaria socialis]
MLVRGVVLLLILAVVPSYSLICYECSCSQPDLSACHCDETSELFGNDYCVIAEQRFTDEINIQLSRIPRNSTYIYIEDPYYILMQESIRYNKTTSDWNLVTTGALFGCDWDYCNSPNLIDALPSSFKFTIEKTWLDTNIYGTGNLSACHTCAFETCGDPANPLNFTQCPLTPCVNVTTCLVYDLWSDFDGGSQCFESQCAPAYLDGEFAETYGGKYRLDIEGVVYLQQDRFNYDIWEIDVYCGAVNCSRPTIFEEIIDVLYYDTVDLAPFPPVRPTTTQAPPTTSTPIENPLTCYNCACIGTTTCTCTSTVVTSLDETYCIVARENIGQEVFINLGYIETDSSYVYILEAPFVLVEETIAYDEQGVRWLTTTDYVVYGCNWNLCNKPALLPLLPSSFQMRLPEPWLNTNILGTGAPVRDCHECPEAAQCGTTEFLDASRCPIKSCNTTCLVLDVFNDPADDLLCYQSFCIPPEADEYNIYHNRVEIEGIIYANEPTVVKIWEIDLYCRADDCSRPEIFKELKDQLIVQPGTLSALFNETHDPSVPQRRCYDCYCYNEPNCECTRSTLMNADLTYCLIIRENYGQDYWITMGHIYDDSTRVSIIDFPYLVSEETIRYNDNTEVWNTVTNFVIFGCDWDLCNDPKLAPYLPRSFQMRLPEAWLNTNVYGNGQPVRDCHECPDAPQCGTDEFLDASRCPIKSCNTTCLVADTYDDPGQDELCYQSFCAPPDSEFFEIDPHRVELEGILYIDKVPRTVELWEVDIFCRADDCSRPEIFKELEAQLTLDVGDLSAFEGLSTTAQPATATTTGQTAAPTTTSNAPVFNSISLFSSVLVAILILIFIN